MGVLGFWFRVWGFRVWGLGCGVKASPGSVSEPFFKMKAPPDLAGARDSEEEAELIWACKVTDRKMPCHTSFIMITQD